MSAASEVNGYDQQRQAGEQLIEPAEERPQFQCSFAATIGEGQRGCCYYGNERGYLAILQGPDLNGSAQLDHDITLNAGRAVDCRAGKRDNEHGHDRQGNLLRYADGCYHIRRAENERAEFCIETLRSGPTGVMMAECL